jgi:aspartyl-tRNA(Asn)/glutamyl-tRNA(Gln) amidotransferase subunit B
MTMIYGGISDCDMEKGQLRCDANVSIRPVGSTGLGTKVEIKNLNSFAFVRDGIEHEIRRQIGVVRGGGLIVQETRDYDGQTGTSQSLRSKEQAHDYRYFPDPDLMPVKVDAAWKAQILSTCPELPFAKQQRFLEQYKIPYTITSVLVPDRELSDYFEEAARLSGKPQAAGNWIANDLLRELGQSRQALAEAKVRPAQLASLIKAIDSGALVGPAAKEVFAAMFRTGEQVEALIEKMGLKGGTDAGELERWCREAIAADPRSLADFKGGKESAINGFKGPVMRAAKGKADPKLVDQTLRRLLAES